MFSWMARNSKVPTVVDGRSGVKRKWLRGLTTCKSYFFVSISLATRKPGISRSGQTWANAADFYLPNQFPTRLTSASFRKGSQIQRNPAVVPQASLFCKPHSARFAEWSETCFVRLYRKQTIATANTTCSRRAARGVEFADLTLVRRSVRACACPFDGTGPMRSSLFRLQGRRYSIST